ASETEDALLLYARSRKINMFKNVVQSDMREVAHRPRQRRYTQAREGGHRVLLGCEGGVNEIEPDDIRPHQSNFPRDVCGRRQAVRIPAPHDVKARQFLLLILTHRFPVLVSSPFISGELVSENREVNQGVSL